MRAVLVSLLMVPVLVGRLPGQEPESGLTHPDRVALGLLTGPAIPTGDFGRYVDAGWSLHFYAAAGGDRLGPLAFRLDVTGVLYGHETVRRPLSPTVPQVSVDVSTDNYFWSIQAGPQIRLGTGRFRGYGYGLLGATYFGTSSSVAGSDALNEPFASSTNFYDWAFALSGGGGLLYTVSDNPRMPISLNLDLAFLRHGRTRYLREGGVVVAPGGGVQIHPIESRTDVTVITMGVQLGGWRP